MKYSIEREKFYTTPRLVSLVRKFSKGKSLDVGCGTGEYFKHFHGSVYGVDLTEEYLKKIDTKKFKSKRVVVKKGDVRKLSFKNEEFDFVFSAAVLEYMPAKKDLKKAVGEMKRVLRKGGFLVVSVPHKNYFTNLVRGSVLSRVLDQKAKDPYFIMGKGYTIDEIKVFGFNTYGCVGWVTWKNINPLLARLLDFLFWSFPLFSGSLIGIYEKK